jgi:hypothetical protein
MLERGIAPERLARMCRSIGVPRIGPCVRHRTDRSRIGG